MDRRKFTKALGALCAGLPLLSSDDLFGNLDIKDRKSEQVAIIKELRDFLQNHRGEDKSDLEDCCEAILKTHGKLGKFEILTREELESDKDECDIKSPEEFVQIIEDAIADGKCVLPADDPVHLRKGFLICDSKDSDKGRFVKIRLVDLTNRQEWLNKIYKISDKLMTKGS